MGLFSKPSQLRVKNNLKGDFHMKKALSIILAAAICLSMAACGNTKDSENKQQDTSPAVTEPNATQPEATEPDAAQPEVTEPTDQMSIEETMLRLVNEGLYCYFDVIELRGLTFSEEEVEVDGKQFHQVTSGFESYAEFEEYVRSVFCKETADLYLNSYPTEETLRFANIDGKLYVNTETIGGKGYYVDWSEYSVVINEQTENRCKLTVTGSIEEPAAEPVKEPYEVKVAAILEDGKWVLEKAIY